MTQENKELLLKDLSARLPYGVMCACGKFNAQLKLVCPDGDYCVLQHSPYEIETIKPYLRSMSSMTEEERDELSYYDNSVQRTDFFYSHHIDCRYMIEKGLALEAPEGMYNLKENKI